MNNNERWTHDDERQLKQLLDKKKKLNDTNREALLLVVKTFDSYEEYDADNLISDLIGFADEIRDALEPFDSGTRLVKE